MLLVEVKSLRRKKAHALSDVSHLVYAECLRDCRLVLLEDAVFDVFAKLAGDRVADLPVVVALVEGVDGVADEKSVFTVHDLEPGDGELVVEDDPCEGLHVPEARAFLERVDLYARNCEAVEGSDVERLLFGLCFGGGVLLCHDVLLVSS